MNKMLTTAMAIAAVAGLASADIETSPAGFVESATGSGTLFCNSLTNFAGSAMTLGDFTALDFGSSDTIRIIGASGKVLFSAKYADGNWYDSTEANPTEAVSSNSFPIARGESIQIQSASGKLFVSGPMLNANATRTASDGYLLIGNVAPVAKKLKDFVVGTGFNASYGDYISFNNVKYVVYGGHWLTKANFDAGNTSSGYYADETAVPAGAGLFLFSKKIKRRVINTAVTLPGTYK